MMIRIWLFFFRFRMYQKREPKYKCVFSMMLIRRKKNNNTLFLFIIIKWLVGEFNVRSIFSSFFIFFIFTSHPCFQFLFVWFGSYRIFLFLFYYSAIFHDSNNNRVLWTCIGEEAVSMDCVADSKTNALAHNTDTLIGTQSS